MLKTELGKVPSSQAPRTRSTSPAMNGITRMWRTSNKAAIGCEIAPQINV
jgi:hypothetical protein